LHEINIVIHGFILKSSINNTALYIQDVLENTEENVDIPF